MRPLSFVTIILCSASLLNSCAYMQTHKNMEESFCSYQGYELATPLKLVQQGGTWYLAAHPVELKKHYPAVYDAILFTENNQPEMSINSRSDTWYLHRISGGTAMVLQRADGYASMTTLCDEIRQEGGAWIPMQKGASVYPIKASLDHAEAAQERLVVQEDSRKPQTLSTGIQVLSWANRILVDYPGTVLYNVAIPFMTPVQFFREFLQGD